MEPKELLGKGLILPFERRGGDFNHGEGIIVIESAMKQIIKTRKGELPWDPYFGLPVMLHNSIDDVTLAQVQADVGTILTKYEPRIEIIDISVEHGGNNNPYPNTAIVISIQWRAVARGRKGNTVLTDITSTEVVI
jgi:phage baseplate assembly protein W